MKHTKGKLFTFVLKTHIPGVGGWGNGYVAIPKEHTCYGMHHDAIHSEYEIFVNGGLTYSGEYQKTDPEEAKGCWIVGFDTLHSWDTPETWPDSESVMKEAERLKEQLENLQAIE